jgi:hypothetical protein
MRPHHGAIEHLHEVRRLAGFRQELEEGLEHARATEPPEPLPDAVPLSELGRQSPPGNAVNREKMQRFQKLTVIVAGFASTGLRRVEHLQRDGPILLRHSRQHGRLPVAGHASIRRKGDSGIPLRDTWSYPSTGPSLPAAVVVSIAAPWLVTTRRPMFRSVRS